MALFRRLGVRQGQAWGQWLLGRLARAAGDYPAARQHYEESVARDGNVLADPHTRDFYRSIRLVTRGPLVSSRRFREIARMNLGLVTPPDWDMYHHTKVPPSSKEGGDGR